jgi:hypothetical protein
MSTEEKRKIEILFRIMDRRNGVMDRGKVEMEWRRESGLRV